MKNFVSVHYSGGLKINEVWIRFPPLLLGCLLGLCVPGPSDEGSGLGSGWLQELRDGDLPQGWVLLARCV